MTHALPVNGTPLTEKRLTILRMVGEGMRHPEIAVEMGCSTDTVHEQMQAILRVLGARNQTQAAVMAAKAGWI